jgi:subtilisin-like proprotein convertase family protein
MNVIKKIAGITVLLAGAVTLPAQSFTNTYSSSPNMTVPDGNPVGLNLNISAMPGGVISQVTVNLDITGGWNGDLYAYLAGPGGGFAVLLNRTGINSDGSSFTDMAGYSDAGFNITFDDNAGNGNIHYYENTVNPGGGQLTGVWMPDGENVDPTGDEVGTSAGMADPAMLASFNGLNPNGTWTLYVADLSSGNTSTVVSWGMTIVTTPEPEMMTYATIGLLSLLVVNHWKQRKF